MLLRIQKMPKTLKCEFMQQTTNFSSECKYSHWEAKNCELWEWQQRFYFQWKLLRWKAGKKSVTLTWMLVIFAIFLAMISLVLLFWRQKSFNAFLTHLVQMAVTHSTPTLCRDSEINYFIIIRYYFLKVILPSNEMDIVIVTKRKLAAMVGTRKWLSVHWGHPRHEFRAKFIFNLNID